jgi:hypothetical protein
MKLLKDTDPMPFGKHKGTPLANVPAKYLLWLWKEVFFDKIASPSDYFRYPLSKYIHENLHVLESEIK